MKIWIVSSLNEETIQEEETIQGRKLFEENTSLPCQVFDYFANWLERELGIFKLQSPAKKYANFAKQDPGRASQSN